MTLTPDQQRRRDARISAFDRRWEFSAASKEIRLKPVGWLKRFFEMFWRRKFSVRTVYLWAKERWSTTHMMSYSFPLTHDNMLKPDEIPYIFALQNGWTIPASDAKRLFEGPLLSETGELIVRPGFGRSLWKIFMFGVIVALTFGAIFQLFPNLLTSTREMTVVTPYYFSIVTLTTLGFGDVLPTGWVGELLIIFKVLIGYMLLGLLVSILADRIVGRT
jgi:hypothetical protein